MTIYLDSGDIKEITEAFIRFPYLSGVTTNPLLVAKADAIIQDLIPAIRQITFKTIFAQINLSTVTDMVEHALGLDSLLHPNAVVKIPFCASGIKTLIKLEGMIKTCITAVSTPAQALISAENGADYVAVYVGRIAKQASPDLLKPDAGIDVVKKVIDVVKKISDLFLSRNLNTRILAASIKNYRWINSLLQMPNVDVTTSLEHIAPLFDAPVTIEAIKQFNELQTLN